MAGIVERLAESAAEKRAQGWLYGGGYGGGFGMNPFLGGMGYGGRWGGGFGGGGFGGYPMMAQSFAGPYGRGGYYGMDPAFRGHMGRMMDLQGQAYERGFPGIDIGLQGQSAGVEAQRQENPALQYSRGLEQGLTQHAMQDPTQVDPRQTQLAEEIKASRTEMAARAKELEAARATGRGIAQRYSPQLREHEKALAALRGGTAGRGLIEARLRDENDMVAERAAKEILGMTDEQIKGIRSSSLFDIGSPLFNRRTYAALRRNIAPFGSDDIQKALEAQEQIKGLRESMEEERRQNEAQVTDLARQQQEYEQQQKQRQQELVDIERRQHELRQRRGVQQSDFLESQREGAGAVTRPSGQAGLDALNRPPQAGTLPNRPAAPPIPQPRPSQGVMPPSASPTPTPLAPPPALPPPTPLRPPQGGQGPRGPIKVASLVELADTAARIRLEKRAALPGFTPGATSLTGLGKTIKSTPELFENLRKSVLPQVARTVSVQPKPTDIMKSLGLPAGIPSTIAHMPVDTAVGMGLTADQHTALRKALGLG